MIKNKKILITGASGFIGSHLVKSLITHNKILGVDRNPSLLVNKKYFHIQKDFRESDFFDSLNSCNMDIEIEADSVEDAIQMVKRGFYHEVEVASKIHKELAPDETWILKEKKEIK